MRVKQGGGVIEIMPPNSAEVLMEADGVIRGLEIMSSGRMKMPNLSYQL
jgi:hypothetical protein